MRKCLKPRKIWKIVIIFSVFISMYLIWTYTQEMGYFHYSSFLNRQKGLNKTRATNKDSGIINSKSGNNNIITKQGEGSIKDAKIKHVKANINDKKQKNQNGGSYDTIIGKKKQEMTDPRMIPFCKNRYLSKADMNNSTFKQNNRTILILIWRKVSYFYKDKFEHCEYKNCKIVYDRAFLKQSKAVVFNAHVYFRIDCMPVKLNGQIWIFLSTESSVHTAIFKKSLYLNMFNWTWTIRRDSDIPAYYGGIKTYNSPNFNMETITRTKRKLVTAIISHCITDGKREKYIHALKSYINIDIYGKCGSLKIPYTKSHNIDLRLLNKTYKFYLSFENSLCRDYISEKVLRVMRANVVPVVRGRVLYPLYIPPHSYINTDHFSNPHSLAQNLLQIAKNITRYKMYHEWRKHYKATTGFNWNLCELCKRLNRQQDYIRLYEDIQEWWSGPENNPFCNSSPNDI